MLRMTNEVIRVSYSMFVVHEAIVMLNYKKRLMRPIRDPSLPARAGQAAQDDKRS